MTKLPDSKGLAAVSSATIVTGRRADPERDDIFARANRREAMRPLLQMVRDYARRRVAGYARERQPLMDPFTLLMNAVPMAQGRQLGRGLICGRPARCKRFFGKSGALSRMLPSVRPLVQRSSCGPVWEFADRSQIINACSRHDESIWFFRPRLADCCAIPFLRPTTPLTTSGPPSYALASTGAL